MFRRSGMKEVQSEDENDDNKEHRQGQKEEESIGTAQEREGKQWTSGIQFGEQICGNIWHFQIGW